MALNSSRGGAIFWMHNEITWHEIELLAQNTQQSHPQTISVKSPQQPCLLAKLNHRRVNCPILPYSFAYSVCLQKLTNACQQVRETRQIARLSYNSGALCVRILLLNQKPRINGTNNSIAPAIFLSFRSFPWNTRKIRDHRLTIVINS